MLPTRPDSIPGWTAAPVARPRHARIGPCLAGLLVAAALVAVSCLLGPAIDRAHDRQRRIVDLRISAEGLPRHEASSGGADERDRVSEFGTRLQRLVATAGGNSTTPAPAAASGWQYAEVQRAWRRLQPHLLQAAATAVEDPSHRLAVEQAADALPRLLAALERERTAGQAAVGRLEDVRSGLAVAGGAVLAAALVALVVTLRRRARFDDALRASERSPAFAATRARTGLVTLEASLHVTWANEAAGRLLGADPDDLAGRPLLPRLSPDVDTLELRRSLRAAAERGEAFERELAWVDAKGQPRLVLLSLGSADGSPARAPLHVIVLTDLSARLAAEHASRDEAELHRRALLAMPEGFIVQAADGRIELSNPAAERILGLDESPLRGRTALDPCWRALREDGAPLPGSEHPAMVSLRTAKASAGSVLAVQRPDGRRVWIRLDCVPIFRGSDDRPYAVASLFSDITARRQSEQALRKLTQAIEQSPVPVLITDASGAIEYVNRRMEEVSGYEAGELMGRNPRALASGETPRRTYEQMWAELRAGRAWQGRVRNRRRNGEAYWAGLSIFPLRDAAGAVTHFVAYGHDAGEAEPREAGGDERARAA